VTSPSPRWRPRRTPVGTLPLNSSVLPTSSKLLLLAPFVELHLLRVDESESVPEKAGLAGPIATEIVPTVAFDAPAVNDELEREMDAID
jgi:hypothetical protein